MARTRNCDESVASFNSCSTDKNGGCSASARKSRHARVQKGKKDRDERLAKLNAKYEENQREIEALSRSGSSNNIATIPERSESPSAFESTPSVLHPVGKSNGIDDGEELPSPPRPTLSTTQTGGQSGANERALSTDLQDGTNLTAVAGVISSDTEAYSSPLSVYSSSEEKEKKEADAPGDKKLATTPVFLHLSLRSGSSDVGDSAANIKKEVSVLMVSRNPSESLASVLQTNDLVQIFLQERQESLRGVFVTLDGMQHCISIRDCQELTVGEIHQLFGASGNNTVGFSGLYFN